ncbi:SPOR domain-containing protein [Ruegeria marina]|uniref:Uncharacterized protein n=1 Tax=Ruegeria marina TaxID=639004 RepID=A0A1G6L8U8_9RHOB|nr:SPOR domain-containing protein [Ruegeria marina]SDC39578.1 hypothetical protein SAMN04488239_102175 [Ruegeria marina]
MRFTRIIAFSVIGCSLGLSALNAQTLRNPSPPAEFPPASFTGKQYVDSRGCIYIRAGVDGLVTWVPRVSRQRKQLCGYQPTEVAGATTTAPQPAGPELITLDQPAVSTPSTPAPKATAAQPPVRTAAASAPKAAPKPAVAMPVTVPTTRTTTARPVPVAPVAAAAPTPSKPGTIAPVATRPDTAICPDASPLSQQYINQTGARCGPQAEPPITYGPLRKSSSGSSGKTGVPVSLETRIVPKHVHDNRQNTTNVVIPAGYRSVWTDDRLNPYRAERTLRPAIVTNTYVTPNGFRAVQRGDDRLNPMRGVRTVEGDAQMNALWSDDLPRKLLPVETAPRTITVIHSERSYRDIAKPPMHLRLSTRNAPDARYPAASVSKRPSR